MKYVSLEEVKGYLHGAKLKPSKENIKVAMYAIRENRNPEHMKEATER